MSNMMEIKYIGDDQGSQPYIRFIYNKNILYSKEHLINVENMRICHHENEPAKIIYNENGTIFIKEYYCYGKLHNLNGPAIVENDNNGKQKYIYFYINNAYIPAFSEQDFLIYKKTMILK